MERLEDNQLEAFDLEYVNDRLWIPVKQCIDRDFPDGHFTFLDVGGGNGLFADRILANYPNSYGVVLDNSSLLLNKNHYNPRKRIILDSVENLGSNSDETFDLVIFNWLLHHLVTHSSYFQSRKNIEHIMHLAKGVLSERGRVSIYENMYNGLFIDGLASWIIYQLTSRKNIANFIRKKGANSAGVGVCFLSYKQWQTTIKKNRFHILDYTKDTFWTIPWTWQVLLHMGNTRCGHFWLSSRK